jgi:cell division protein FtsB
MSATVTAPAPRSGRLSPRLRRLLWPMLVAVTVLVVLAIGVFPTRQYLEQRSETASRAAVLAQLREQNGRLQAQVDALRTDAEVERIARAEYSLVFPGEETYAVLPPPRSASRVPTVWPFQGD